MKRARWMIPIVCLVGVAFAGPVYHMHDKWPMRGVHAAAPDPAGVPEPGALALMALGVGGVILAACRRK